MEITESRFEKNGARSIGKSHGGWTTKVHEVERLFGRLKGFRRIFTRYDKLDVIFTSFIHLALGAHCRYAAVVSTRPSEVETEQRTFASRKAGFPSRRRRRPRRCRPDRGPCEYKATR